MGCIAIVQYTIPFYWGLETSLHSHCRKEIDVAGLTFNPNDVSSLHVRKLLFPDLLGFRITKPCIQMKSLLEPKFVDLSTLDDKLARSRIWRPIYFYIYILIKFMVEALGRQFRNYWSIHEANTAFFQIIIEQSNSDVPPRVVILSQPAYQIIFGNELT